MKRQQALVDKLWQPSHRSLKRHNASVKRPLLFWLMVATVLLCGRTECAQATVFNIADGDVPGLIAAINTANSNAQLDVINLAANGAYTLSAVNHTTNGATGLPTLGDDISGPDLTINGNGATIQRSVFGGTPDFRILQINDNADVTINNLIVVSGRVVQGSGGHGGGGIYNRGRLTLVGCTLNSNSVVGQNGFNGGECQDGGPGSHAFGGGVYSTGSVMVLTNCTFLLNSVVGGNGGNGGSHPDNISCEGDGGDGGSGYGGGIFGANLTVSGCTFQSNSAAGGIGGSRGPGVSGVFNGDPGSGIGGGVYIDGGTIDKTTVRQNTATSGAGVAASATLLTNSTLLNNTAAYAGGGLSSGGVTTLHSCTISGNSAGPGGLNNPGGGAIYNSSGFTSQLIIVGCTLSNNTPSAIYNASVVFFGPGSVSLANTILHGSTPSFAGTVGGITSSGYNLSTDAAGGDNGTGAGGTLNNTGDIRNTDPQLDPAGLQNNGGSTQTIKLLSGSPAIDKGKSFGVGTDQRGRGRPDDDFAVANASGGDGSDIGAYEVLGSPQPGPSLVVSVLEDRDDGGGASACTGDCTLREAIIAANALPGDNTISFAPSVVGTIFLSSALPEVTTNIDFYGPGARVLAIDGNLTYRVLAFSSASNSTVSGLTLRNGIAVGAPGEGGGIRNAGALQLENCSITSNRAAGFGGGISSPEEDGLGGGIFNSGSLTAASCTISANFAIGEPGHNSSFFSDPTDGGLACGGIYNATGATLNLMNCTIAGNTASGGQGGRGTGGDDGGDGGAAYGAIYSAGTMVVSASTISANSATGGAGGTGSPAGTAGAATGGVRCQAGSASLSNSIVAANTSPGTAPDLSGAFTSSGFNLIGNSTGATGFPGPSDQIGVSPQLSPLQNNGGPTDTMALLAGSPAINTGDPNAPAQDQRYYLRSGVADRGAFEFGGALAPIRAVSRKIHGTGGPTFDINLPLTGPVGIECRKGQGTNSNDHQVILTFPVAVTVESASASPDPSPTPAATGSVSSVSVSGSQVTVNLTGVSNAQRLGITLNNVSDGVNTNSAFVLRAGMLVGDVNGSGIVTSGDTNLCKAQALQPLTNSNFRDDINASGAITTGDVNLIKQNALTALP